MSLTGPKTYLRTALDVVGFREHDDGFASDNIPSTIIDGSYHLEIGTITSGPANQIHYVFTFPVTVRLFFKGYADPKGTIDQVLEQGDNVLKEVLKTSERLGQIDGIKDVIPSSIQVIPLDGTNDNSMILEMEFQFNIIECF